MIAVSVGITVDALTTQATWLAAVALVALMLLGWRRATDRRTPRPVRRLSGDTATRDETGLVEVERLAPVPYRRPGPIRRILAGVATGGLSIVIGAVTAVIIAFASIYLVVTVTGLLDR